MRWRFFIVQFGPNKHELIFLRTTKLDEPVGHVQFVVFEKFTRAYNTKLQEK